MMQPGWYPGPTIPPLTANVAELRTRITAAVAEVTPEMPRSLWQDIGSSAALRMEVISNHNYPR
jgi:hypothetical protein